MKKFNLFVSLVLVLSLLPIFPAFAAEDVAPIAEEVVEAVSLTETEAFAKLEAFGIMTAEDSIVSADVVSRAQFMTYVMKCWLGRGISAASISTENPFSDIASGTAGAAEIAAAAKLGIISAGDKFRPDDPITMSEAAKIMVSVLGYGEIAANRGGYPTGYLTLASQHDIFEGCEATAEGYIPAAGFCQALVNTLEADVMEISAIWQNRSGYGSTYTTQSGRTLLEYAFGIYRAEGIVESNEYTSINGTTQMYADRVQIGREIYKHNDTIAPTLLGYNTEVYYSLDKPEANRIIEYIAPINNEVLTVETADIAKDAVTATNFAYYDEAKDKLINETIPRSASLIYNGGLKVLDKASLCPANGSVTLVDNDDDGKTDVIFVMNYRTILVSDVSLSSNNVSDILGGPSIELDSDADEYDVYIDVDGVPADITAITARSVISYAESEKCAKNVKYVKVSTKTVSGKPEIIGEETIVIDGVEYDIDKNLIQNITFNDECVFYIDYTGKIVARKLEKDVVYGYFNKVIKESGMSDVVRAQIFTENNRWVELDFKDKITYDGKGGTKSTVFYDDWNKGRVMGKLLTYTVDADGKVNMVTQPKLTTYDPYSEDIENDVFRVHEDPYANGDGLVLEYSPQNENFNHFQSRFFVDSETKIFCIPTDGDMEKFAVVGNSELESAEKFKNITPYDYDKFKTAGALVVTAQNNTTRDIISVDASFLLVTNVVETFNSADEPVKAIKGYYKGVLITLPLANNDVLKDAGGKDITLSRGDVIRFSMNEYGDISMIDIRYDYDPETPQNTANYYSHSYGFKDVPIDSTPYGYTNTFWAGTAEFSDAEKNKLCMDIGDIKIIQSTKAATAIYVYDYDNDTFTSGTFADMEKGTRMLVRSKSNRANEIIIFH